MKHYSAATNELPKNPYYEAAGMAKEFYDELAEINKTIQLVEWQDTGDGVRAKQILVREGDVAHLEKLLAKGFSWRTKL
jgi:hypothetical protein